VPADRPAGVDSLGPKLRLESATARWCTLRLANDLGKQTVHMSRGGHNWKGGGTVEGTRSLDVRKLARAGYFAGSKMGAWQWSYRDGSIASVLISGGRDTITLDYRFKSSREDWQRVSQRIPIEWTSCRFGGERPWFICDVKANDIRCGRRVARLYSGGQLFACRHCYRLGYAVQRGGPMDRAHYQLARLHRKLGVDYAGPDMSSPLKPKSMHWRTYRRLTQQIEACQEQLDVVFMNGAQRILARLERAQHRDRRRRWTLDLRRLK
jgi:hypothetical protein